jgi:hypothetical protein
MSKTFTIAGTSNLNGKVKYRFANGTVKHREQVLGRNGHTEIKLVELPRAMGKEDALSFLESQAIMAPTVTVTATKAAKPAKAAKVTAPADAEPAPL